MIFYSLGHLSCPDGWFYCNNSSCINPSYRCDGHVDCANGSDEKGCSPGSQLIEQTKNNQSVGSDCGSDEFKCKSGQCTLKVRICDGKNDCSDRSDESFDLCKTNEASVLMNSKMLLQLLVSIVILCLYL
jgi:hypothetical protein